MIIEKIEVFTFHLAIFPIVYVVETSFFACGCNLRSSIDIYHLDDSNVNITAVKPFLAVKLDCF